MLRVLTWARMAAWFQGRRGNAPL